MKNTRDGIFHRKRRRFVFFLRKREATARKNTKQVTEESFSFQEEVWRG